jgi:hypothetical protein
MNSCGKFGEGRQSQSLIVTLEFLSDWKQQRFICLDFANHRFWPEAGVRAIA